MLSKKSGEPANRHAECECIIGYDLETQAAF